MNGAYRGDAKYTFFMYVLTQANEKYKGDASCDKNNPIIEKTANNPVPAINVGLIPILSYSFPAESDVTTVKTEPKIVANPYVVSEKPHMDFVKIGKTIAFPKPRAYLTQLT